MLCVRAPLLEKRLINLVQSTGKSKSHYVRMALQALFETIEHTEEEAPNLHRYVPLSSPTSSSLFTQQSE